MDSILNKLTEIESAASAIVENAESQKSVLDREFDEKRKAFDDELEAKTMERIHSIRTDMEKKTQALLNTQSTESGDALEALREEYEKRHTEYARAILRRITEV